jgi:hypothetical protein
MSTEFGIWIPPPPPDGSEKLGTPLARMQSANLIPGSSPALWLGLLEEPHPASKSAAAATVAVERVTQEVVLERE